MNKLLLKQAEPTNNITRKLPKLCFCCGFETELTTINKKRYWICHESFCGYKEMTSNNERFYAKKQKEPENIFDFKGLNIKYEEMFD